MKKIRKTIILTLLLLAGLTAGLYFLLTGNGGGEGTMTAKINEQQSDLLSDEKAFRIDLEQSSVELKKTGVGKNVVEFGTKDVYQTKTSADARARLDHLIERTGPTLNEPVIVSNPFGTCGDSLFFSFQTAKSGMVRYTITVSDSSVPDFVRYVDNGKENNLSRNHEFVVSGFVPGQENYLIIEVLNKAGTVLEKKAYRYNAPASAAASPVPHEETGNSEKPKNGLFAVLPSGDKNIYLYDNSGILRGTVLTESAHGNRFYQSGNSVLYQVAPARVAKVSGTGQVMGMAQVKGYGSIIDFSYDGYDNIYSIGKKKGVYYLLGTSFQSGKTSVLYRFPKGIVPSSITMPSAGSVYAACSSPSGIVKLEALTSERPKVSFVLGKSEDWKNTKWKKKAAEDSVVSRWNLSGALLYTDERGSSDGSDSVTSYVLDNKKGTGVQFTIDSGEKTVKVVHSFPLGESGRNTCEAYEGHYILTNREQGEYAEYDVGGLVTRRFRYGKKLDGVTKVSLEGICFYAG